MEGELQKMSTAIIDDEDEKVSLPGFRFHPTDEELVGFYLRRKVEKKLVTLDLIKQIDIYSHDPWDLPSMLSLESFTSTLCSLITTSIDLITVICMRRTTKII